MSWRVVLGVFCMAIGCMAIGCVATGCTAIRPLDPLDGASRRDVGAAGDGSIDAAPASDGSTSDAFADDTGLLVDAARDDANTGSADSGIAPDAFDANCGLEMCGGGDEDCDGMIDEAGAVGSRAFYQDVDLDGYGADATLVMVCTAPPTGRWVTRGGDCDDTNRQVNPGRAEMCNGIDDDCNGLIDDGIGSCLPFSCTTLSYAGHTYLFCGDNRSQAEAANSCTAMGYHLVNIGDMAENDFVQMNAMALGLGTGGLNQGVWIGLVQSGGGGYTWTDGTVATYLHWDSATLEPNHTGTCVRMRSTSGYWADFTCVNGYPYICESP